LSRNEGFSVLQNEDCSVVFTPRKRVSWTFRHLYFGIDGRSRLEECVDTADGNGFSSMNQQCHFQRPRVQTDCTSDFSSFQSGPYFLPCPYHMTCIKYAEVSDPFYSN
jgi:hypothetical protein